jgi:hypothetical protein
MNMVGAVSTHKVGAQYDPLDWLYHYSVLCTTGKAARDGTFRPEDRQGSISL